MLPLGREQWLEKPVLDEVAHPGPGVANRHEDVGRRAPGSDRHISTARIAIDGVEYQISEHFAQFRGVSLNGHFRVGLQLQLDGSLAADVASFPTWGRVNSTASLTRSLKSQILEVESLLAWAEQTS